MYTVCVYINSYKTKIVLEFKYGLLLVFYRLSCHYEVKKGDQATLYDQNSVKMEDIMSKSDSFFKQQGQLPPTKVMLSKLVNSMFGVYGKRQSKITFYPELRERIEIPDNSDPNDTLLSIPENCDVECTDNVLKVKLRKEYVINGENVVCSVEFRESKTVLFVHGKEIPLEILITPSPSSVKGLVRLLQDVKICKGMTDSESENMNIPSGIKEKWLEIDGTTFNSLPRIRSQSCEVMMSWIGNSDACKACLNLVSTSNKRKRHIIEASSEQGPVVKKLRTPLSELQNENVQRARPTSDLTLSKKMEILKDILPEGIPEYLPILIESQLQNCDIKLEKHQRRWHPILISVCLSLYCRSPKAYQDLSNSGLLLLPTKSTLTQYKNTVKQAPGLQNENLQWMQQEASRKNLTEFGKRGGLILDEMTVQEDLQIQRKDDAWEVIGGEDMGPTNNAISTIVRGQQNVKLATSVVQIIFHGYTGFRWPVVFYSSTTANTYQLFNIIWHCISELEEYGFVVDYIMFDGASANRSLTNLMANVHPKLTNYTIKDVFDNNHLINIVQDIKHVLKKIRNNIESSKSKNSTTKHRYLKLGESPIVWEHFEDAFAFNNQSGLRIHKSLTKEHIFLTGASKMRNKLATDILSKDMLYLMKTFQSTLKDGHILSSTITLLTYTSEIVDIFLDTRPINSLTDPRLNTLNKVLNFFHQWENESLKASNLITKETREDIDSSLLGFMALCKRVVTEGHSLTPSYVNSDIIENHFCQQRGIYNGLNTNPTVQQYGPANNAIILGQTTLSGKCNTGQKATYYNARKLKKTGKRDKSALRRL